MQSILKHIAAGVAAIVLVGATATVHAQSAQDILEKAQQKQQERWQGVDVYLVEKTLMGQTVDTYFRRTLFTAEDGSEQTVFLPFSAHQMAGQCPGAQKLTPEQLMAFADAQEMTGDALSDEMDRSMTEAGLPPGMLAGTGSSPNATLDPRVMMGGNAEFLRAAARAQEAENNRDLAAEAREQAGDMEAFMQQARLVGTENVDGRKAFHLRAEGVNQVQEADGNVYRMDTVNMWFDASEYVPLRMKVEGTMTSGAEVKPMVIENTMSDYRQVPGSKMYESYKHTVSMSGMLDASQEAEMREAQKQLAEMEKQMASMPASQRQMMEQMMGPQLDMVRKMAAGGGLEMETVIDRIVVNPAFKLADGTSCGANAASATKTSSKSNKAQPGQVASASGASGSVDVLSMVQRDLQTLGYAPGNVNGQMDTATAIAISKFQAENGLQVTGEASPQLAGILAARTSSSSSAPAAAAPRDPASLQAAQQACLEQKMAEAQEAQKKKRGFGRLLSGVSRMAGRMGNYDLARGAGDIYTAGATADDFSQAAKDLGLTEDEIAACQNP